MNSSVNEIDNAFNIVNNTNEIVKESKENNLDIATVETRKAQKLYEITEADRDLAINMSLVPENYRNSKFDTNLVRENLIRQHKQSGGIYTIRNFQEYEETLYGLLSVIRARELPNKSFLIGAPNGFGKTSFVMESIITCNAIGFKTVPYISLWELGQIRVDNEQKILKPFRRYENLDKHIIEPNLPENKNFKQPEIVTGRYSYSEYINADILFTYLTDVISKEAESHALYQILNIRGSKGLPTICFISTSLDPYINDKRLKELVWDEILTNSISEHTYDRIYHISTYKRRRSGIESKNENIETETGIVL